MNKSIYRLKYKSNLKTIWIMVKLRSLGSQTLRMAEKLG